VDASGKINGNNFTSATNVVANEIPGISFTLKGVTGAANPVTLTVGAPGPDKNAIAAKVKAFVDQYNSTVTFIRSKLDEKPVPNATTTADQNKGVLYGDTALSGLLSQMRIAMTSAYTADGTVSTDFDQMTEIGVTTGKTTGSAAVNQDSVAGKLSFDQDAFMTALTKDSASVRKMLSGTVTNGGFAQAFDAMLKPTVQVDGTIDQTIKSQDALKRALADQITRMDQTLQQKQDLLKKQFAAMEAAMQSSQSQGQWLSGQLAALNNR
jgi:flagellar hook-associated protein 2